MPNVPTECQPLADRVRQLEAVLASVSSATGAAPVLKPMQNPFFQATNALLNEERRQLNACIIAHGGAVSEAEKPPVVLSSRAQKLAADYNLSAENATTIANGIEALINAEWDFSWWSGIITATMDPKGCTTIAACCAAIASLGLKELIGAIGAAPWYVVAAWGFMVLEAGIVGGVMADCGSKNKRGEICFWPLLGLWWAEEAD